MKRHRTKPEPQPCPDHMDRTELWCWEWREGETSDDAEPVCVEGCDHPDHDDSGCEPYPDRRTTMNTKTAATDDYEGPSEDVIAKAKALGRRRFTVIRLYMGEMCKVTGERAETVLRTLGHTRTIKGWPDRHEFDRKLTTFMATTKPGGSMMVDYRACIVRER